MLLKGNCSYFWEQACTITGLVKDRTAIWHEDGRILASIAATGFGLTSLCNADSRGYRSRAVIKSKEVG